MSDDFVNCQECGDSETNTSLVTVPRRTSNYSEVAGYAVESKCPVRHAIDAADVLITYGLDREVACSFPGSHRHKSGLIARTRCGKVVRVGHICGTKSLIGFEAVSKAIGEAQRLMNQLAELHDAASEDEQSLSNRLLRASAEVREISKWRSEVLDPGAIERGEILSEVVTVREVQTKDWRTAGENIVEKTETLKVDLGDFKGFPDQFFKNLDQAARKMRERAAIIRTIPRTYEDSEELRIALLGIEYARKSLDYIEPVIRNHRRYMGNYETVLRARRSV